MAGLSYPLQIWSRGVSYRHICTAMFANAPKYLILLSAATKDRGCDIVPTDNSCREKCLVGNPLLHSFTTFIYVMVSQVSSYYEDFQLKFCIRFSFLFAHACYICLLFSVLPGEENN